MAVKMGRPRIWRNEAARLKAYRAKKRLEAEMAGLKGRKEAALRSVSAGPASVYNPKTAVFDPGLTARAPHLSKAKEGPPPPRLTVPESEDRAERRAAFEEQYPDWADRMACVLKFRRSGYSHNEISKMTGMNGTWSDKIEKQWKEILAKTGEVWDVSSAVEYRRQQVGWKRWPDRDWDAVKRLLYDTETKTIREVG